MIDAEAARRAVDDNDALRKVLDEAIRLLKTVNVYGVEDVMFQSNGQHTSDCPTLGDIFKKPFMGVSKTAVRRAIQDCLVDQLRQQAQVLASDISAVGIQPHDIRPLIEAINARDESATS